jgi:hypothetical protein
VRQFSHEEKGDWKPLQFLRHFKSLALDVPDDFIRTIWYSRLPPHVQTILADQTYGSLDSASNLADRICEVTPQSIKAIASPVAPDNTTGLLDKIGEIEELTAHKLETIIATPTNLRHPTPAGTTLN